MLKPQIKLLMIEDNPGDARLIREMLTDASSVQFQLKIADRLSQGLDFLAAEAFDALLLDLSLPDSQGLETIVKVHTASKHIPIVVLTGYDDETVGIAAVQEGAQDYLVKGQVDTHLIVRALRYAIERKRTESELDMQRAQMYAILDSMGEGVIYHNGFQAEFTNRALTFMTGFNGDEFQGYLDLIYAGNGDTLKALEARIEHGVSTEGVWQGEVRLRRQDGSEFDAALTCTPVLAADREMTGLVTILRDISQEKALEAQKARFVANASHEMRTPLTNLRTTLYLLRRQPDRATEHIATLEYITERLRNLVDDLLDVTRFERGAIPIEPRVIRLQDPIEEVNRIQKAEAERKDITLTTELCSSSLYANVDPKRLLQVITNLVINAINYTPNGGYVAINLERDGQGVAVITVQDSGIGIPIDVLPQVFQPFFRVSEGTVKGTGLGLTISKEIVELHGGTLTVESEVGRGSAFKVRLGLVEVPAENAVSVY
jgi:PAS domain S-box-containing protein